MVIHAVGDATFAYFAQFNGDPNLVWTSS